MKLGFASEMLAGATLALLLGSGVAVAAPSPQQDAQQQMDQQRQQYEQQQRAAQEQENQAAQQHGTKKGKAAPSLYPNATRKSPDIPPILKHDADQLNSGLAAINAKNVALATQILSPYADGSATNNKYLQAVALQALANVDYNAGKIKSAILKLQQSLATNALPNDTYFNLMYELAQFYYADQQYSQALATLQQWRAEGKRETADSYGLEGILDYQLQQYKPAIAAITKAKSLTTTPHKSWDDVLAGSYAQTGQGDQAIAMARKLVAANPGDANDRHNLISLLMSTGKYPEALKELETARSMGELATPSAYMNMATLYLQEGQASGKDPRPYADKALAVLKDGAAKGVIKPDFAYYKLLGDANTIGGYNEAALEAYTKASPLGTDGSADLNRAAILATQGKFTASRNAAHQALSKGTPHKGQAYMLIAKAERALNNKAAAVTAMKKAAQYPETRDAALAWLKRAGY